MAACSLPGTAPIRSARLAPGARTRGGGPAGGGKGWPPAVRPAGGARAPAPPAETEQIRQAGLRAVTQTLAAK